MIARETNGDAPNCGGPPDRDAPDLPAEARRNRATLDEALAAEGFSGLPTEWWHFDGPDWERYPILDTPFDAAGRRE